MPAVLPMRSVGAASKRASGGARGVVRGRAEQDGEVVAMKSGGMGLLSSQLRACGAAAKGTEASKRFGNGVDVENRFGGSQYISSGSEHELNSVCLGAMVDRFMEDEADSSGRSARSRCSCKLSGSVCDCDFDDYRSSFGGELSEILQDRVPSASVTERMLLAEVNKAVAAAAMDGGASTCLRRQVMKRLRTIGYNAAICKSRWEHVGSFPGGDYEYIDVVFEGATGKSERILIDIEFRAQFEIARPSSSYNAVVQVLPPVFVGKADRLIGIVNIMSEAVKQSLKKSGLDLAPWRKPEYMRAKWFSAYRRTTNDTVHKSHGEDNHASRTSFSARCMEEMEVDYLRGGERRAMKDLKNLVAKKPSEAAISKPAPVPAVVNNCDWTPPALKPRVFQRRGQAGLASILKEAGLTSSLRSLIEEQRKALPIAV